MGTVEEFCKAQDGIERRSDLITHVQQEGVLQLLGLLCFLTLFHQTHLGICHLGLIAAQSEILGHKSLFVCHGNKTEAHIDIPPLLIMEDGMQHLRDITCFALIHSHEQPSELPAI